MQAVVSERTSQGNAVRALALVPSCPRNCKRLADDHEYHWRPLSLGRWFEATTREPGNLLPVMVCANASGGVLRCRKSSLGTRHMGEAGMPGDRADGLLVAVRAVQCLYSLNLRQAFAVRTVFPFPSFG